MKILILLFTILLYATSFASTPAFKTIRYEEDWSSLKEKNDKTFWEKLKYIPIGENSFFSFGGELRERYEYFSNFLWGRPLNEKDGYFLHRAMLHLDFHYSTSVRAFVQLKSATVSGKTLPPRSIDKDVADLHQAFAEFDSENIAGRIGRQEMNYGSSRLISTRDGPNVRQSYDAAKFMFHNDMLKLDAFLSRPVETKPDAFDDGSDRKKDFYGIYSTLWKTLDLYWLWLVRYDAAFSAGIAKENRHTIGARWFSPSQSHSSIDYDLEAVLQEGTFGDQNIHAWTIATHTGFTFADVKMNPRIGLKANIASGDGSSKSLNTFNALFPKNSYFNEAAILGPANIMDVHPSFTITPDQDLKLSVDWDFIWRNTLSDGLYNSSLTPIVSNLSDKRFVGSQLALTSIYDLSRFINVTAQYVHFFTGAYLKSVTPGRDIDYFTLWGTFKF